MLKDDEIIEELDKKYKIIQKKGGYKYAEDTILLFNYLKKSLSKRNIKLLDIGTGNGILPILLSDNDMIEEIVGIDIQKENIERANKALELNEIEKKINFTCLDVKEYKNANYFDVVISNPPYMEDNGKKINENEHRALSRHEIKLNLDEFIQNAKRLLKPIGTLYFIHRTHRLIEIIKTLDKNKFSVKKIIFVFSKNNTSSMMIIEALKGKKIKLEMLKWQRYQLLVQVDGE